MDRAAAAARFVAFATAIYIVLLAAAPAKAWEGTVAEHESGALAQALSELIGSPAAAASMAGPFAVAVFIAVAQAVSRAASR